MQDKRHQVYKSKTGSQLFADFQHIAKQTVMAART